MRTVCGSRVWLVCVCLTPWYPVPYIYCTRCITLLNFSWIFLCRKSRRAHCPKNALRMCLPLYAFSLSLGFSQLQFQSLLALLCGGLSSMSHLSGGSVSLTNPSTGTCPVLTCLALQRMNPAPRNGLERWCFWCSAIYLYESLIIGLQIYI